MLISRKLNNFFCFSLKSRVFLGSRYLCCTMRGYVHRAGADGKAERSAAYIALGTNFGGNLRLKILEDAIESIQKEIGSIDACSCLYESLPGYDVVAHQKKETHDLSLPLHLNAVLRVKTNTTDPNSLLEILQAIELKHGRDRSSTAVRLHRKLDLDLLFFQDAHANTIEIQTEKLTLPHPRLHNRNFVLFPLCDIQPDLVHPPTRKQIKDLLVENLQRREEVLKGACSSSSDGNTAPAVYTLDGNLAIPRRCFALNGHQLWTVKGGAEAAVSDTLRWIEEVLKKYEIKENNAASDTPPPAFADTLLGLRRFLLQEPRGPRLMGVLNVTPDSFSDGLKFYNNVEAAMQHAQRMIDDGADVIDVGGEATNPTNPAVQEEVSVHSEIQRVVPVIEAIRKEIGKDFVISVDTRRSPVAEAAVAAGADLINDVSGGDADPGLLRFTAAEGFPLVVMHSRGTPSSMDSLAKYEDVVKEVAENLTEKINSIIKLGLPRWRIIVDVGLGFAKTPKHSLELISRLKDIRCQLPTGLPLLLGHSRKRFIGWAIALRQKAGGQGKQKEKTKNTKDKTKEEEMLDRDIAGLAVACWASGIAGVSVDLLRVHDVKSTSLACAVMNQLVSRQKEQQREYCAADFAALYPALNPKP